MLFGRSILFWHQPARLPAAAWHSRNFFACWQFGIHHHKAGLLKRPVLRQNVGAITAYQWRQSEPALKMRIYTITTEEFLAALDRVKREGRRIVSAERGRGGRGWTITVTDTPGQQFEPFSSDHKSLAKSTGTPSPRGFGRM